MAEHGFFAKELNTGWAEWQEGQLPVHEDHAFPQGRIHCTCSLDAAGADAAPATH